MHQFKWLRAGKAVEAVLTPAVAFNLDVAEQIRHSLYFVKGDRWWIQGHKHIGASDRLILNEGIVKSYILLFGEHVL